jgi:type II secretory ATPase GspE/PulE/Tfp pilus assembly ATPase PilB-like protein
MKPEQRRDRDASSVPGEGKDTLGEMIRFWAQLGTLQASGVPLLTSLEIQRTQAELPDVQEAISRVCAAIRSGKRLSQAVAAFPGLFSIHVQELCRVGEIQGELDKTCQAISKGLASGALPLSSAGGKSLEVERTERAEEEPTIRKVEALLDEGIHSRASDIHLEPNPDGGQVRLRIDGFLQPPTPMDKETYDAVVTRLQLLSGVDVAEKNLPQDGRMVKTFEGKEYDIRVSFMRFEVGIRGKGSYSAVARILAPQAPIFKFEELGASPETLAAFKQWASSPWGIFIVSGPTGSGKTTILYSLLGLAATPGRKILSIEDPVEYILPGVLQAQLRPGIGMTFSAAVRSFMRQDPDVIVVGEIRDREMALLLPAVALTGHLLFTTLHTRNATEVPQRLADLGLEPWLIRDALKGASSSRIVRKVCQNCREPDMRDFAELLAGLPDAAELKQRTFVRGKGCEKCRNSGYRGRIGLFELMAVTDELAALIAKSTPPADLRRAAVAAGMVTLRRDGLRKAAQGITTVDEVLRVTSGTD